MTTNADIARDILFEAYSEVIGRGLLSNTEKDDLGMMLTEFTDHQIEERPLTDDEIYEIKNKEYIGYRWKEN